VPEGKQNDNSAAIEQMKRFDKGIELLSGIDSNTRLLVDSQKTLVDGQDKMITILGKIESKLR